MPASSQSVHHDRTGTQDNRYAVYDAVEEVLCHTDDGVAVTDSRTAAAEMVPAVADEMGLSDDRLTVVRLTITPVDASAAGAVDDEGHEPDAAGTTDAAHTTGSDRTTSSNHTTSSDRTTGSIMVTRGPHRRNSKLVEYREVEDGAWAVKTPEDDVFWIFMRSGTERDVQHHIRAKWDATYSNPDAFTDQSCPTRDL